MSVYEIKEYGMRSLWNYGDVPEIESIKGLGQFVKDVIDGTYDLSDNDEETDSFSQWEEKIFKFLISDLDRYKKVLYHRFMISFKLFCNKTISADDIFMTELEDFLKVIKEVK
jgi:hypothetical protein